VRSKFIAQGGLAQDIEGVESPQIIKVENVALFEERQAQVELSVNFYFLNIGISYYQEGCNTKSWMCPRSAQNQPM
jgi:hypothetical protein